MHFSLSLFPLFFTAGGGLCSPPPSLNYIVQNKSCLLFGIYTFWCVVKGRWGTRYSGCPNHHTLFLHGHTIFMFSHLQSVPPPKRDHIFGLSFFLLYRHSNVSKLGVIVGGSHYYKERCACMYLYIPSSKIKAAGFFTITPM